VTAAAELSAIKPSLRAAVAGRYLDQFANARGVDPAKQAAVAHLVNADLIGRDAVLFAAAADRNLTAALLDIYRGAPEKRGPAAATPPALRCSCRVHP